MNTTDTILGTTKEFIGIPLEDDSFDPEIITLIDMTMATLSQIGCGSKSSSIPVITKDYTWQEYFDHIKATDSENIMLIPSYVHIKVNVLFDKTIGGSYLDALNKQIDQLEWRINDEFDKG